MDDPAVKRSKARRAAARHRRARAEQELDDELQVMQWTAGNWEHLAWLRFLKRRVGPGKWSTPVVLWGTGLLALLTIVGTVAGIFWP